MSKLSSLIPSIVSIVLVLEAESVNWCQLDCITKGGNVKNTMCEYPARKSTFSCHALRDSSAPNTISQILHLHNKLRSELAGGEVGWPTAANMRQMNWDEALEAVALRWALQCTPQPDKCRRTPDFYMVGQNYCILANWKYYVDGPVNCFNGWTGGISMNASTIDSFQGGHWAYLSQIIWAESFKLGCAQVHFRQRGRGIYWRKTALVCNYGPGGNIITRKIYQRGDPCRECPNKTSCRPNSEYPHLCALPSDPLGPKDFISDNIHHNPAYAGAGIISTNTLVRLWPLMILFILQNPTAAPGTDYI